MKRYNYDFHIHSALSPCGDNDMTPNNVVNMALLSDCDIIAITDHNTCKNAPAFLEVGDAAGLLVVPGMELCVSEEAHIVCLFETLKGAMEFDELVALNMPVIPNRTDIFGEQQILNNQDEQVSIESNMLLVATYFSSENILERVNEFGGVAFPAHVDRASYSIIASLGTIPKEAGFSFMELTHECDESAFLQSHMELLGYEILKSSDAHTLERLAHAKNQIELSEKTRKGVIDRLKNASKKKH